MFGIHSCSGRRRPDFFCLAFLFGWAIGAAFPLYAQGSFLPGQPHAQRQAMELPHITLRVGERGIVAEVAANDASRARGLMFRERLAPDHGMLFVFPEAIQLCFWMKNTPLPLTVAFIDTQGVIVSLADMRPLSLQPHCAIAPALYALEMEQGWFARHGAGPGTRVHGLPGRATE